MRRPISWCVGLGVPLTLLPPAAAQPGDVPNPHRLPSQVVIVPNQQYVTAGGIPLYLDVALPPLSFHGLRPGIVQTMFQGLESSNRKHPQAVDLATGLAKIGYVVFTITVRTPTHGWDYPAAEKDARKAVAWVRDHAAKWDTKKTRLAAVGASGGGYLAAALGYDGSGKLTTGKRVRAVATFSAPTNLWNRYLQSGHNQSRVIAYLGCDPMAPGASQGCIHKAKEASPVKMVGPVDPQMFITHSMDEIIPIGHAKDMRKKLLPHDLIEAADFYHELAGTTHGYGLVDNVFNSLKKFFAEELLPS
jgi:acetyl esterase/lipase